MRVLKRLLFACGVLLLGFGINVAMAQEPKPQALQGALQPATHLLIRAEDLQPFGDVDILTPQKRIQPNDPDIPNVVRGWQRGYKVDMLVLAENGNFAMVNSAVYTFDQPASAQRALDKIPDPQRLPDFAWQAARQDAAALDQEDIQALNGRYWRAWQGVDDEGVPAYVMWLQDGAHVAEVHLNVALGQEAFGQMLFRSLIEILLERIGSSEQVLDTRSTPPSLSDVPSRPQVWRSNVRANQFEIANRWHILAVWSLPKGHSPHFLGKGGDATTCPSNHGCISRWVWWLQEPQSKLGIPKGWWATNIHNGSANPRNYSATVWFD